VPATSEQRRTAGANHSLRPLLLPRAAAAAGVWRSSLRALSVRDGTRSHTRRARVPEKRACLCGADAARSAAPLRGCLRACVRPGPAGVRCGRASRLRWPAKRAVRASGVATLATALRRRTPPAQGPGGALAHARLEELLMRRAGGPGGRAGAPGCRGGAGRATRIGGLWRGACCQRCHARPFSATMLRAEACGTAALLLRRRGRGGGLPALRADASSAAPQPTWRRAACRRRPRTCASGCTIS
jgi:hypothetical protein